MTRKELAEVLPIANYTEGAMLRELEKDDELDSPLADAIAERVRKSARINALSAIVNRGNATECALGRELFERGERSGEIFALLAERIERRKARQ